MDSKYKSSIWLVRCLADENPYRLKTDKEFLDKYAQKPDCRLVLDFDKEFKNLHDEQKKEMRGSLSECDDILAIMDRIGKYREIRSSKYPYAMPDLESRPLIKAILRSFVPGIEKSYRGKFAS